LKRESRTKGVAQSTTRGAKKKAKITDKPRILGWGILRRGGTGGGNESKIVSAAQRGG